MQPGKGVLVRSPLLENVVESDSLESLRENVMYVKGPVLSERDRQSMGTFELNIEHVRQIPCLDF